MCFCIFFSFFWNDLSINSHFPLEMWTMWAWGKRENQEQNKARWRMRRRQKTERKQNISICAAECLERLLRGMSLICLSGCNVNERCCSVHEGLRLHCETPSKLITGGGNFRRLSTVCHGVRNNIGLQYWRVNSQKQRWTDSASTNKAMAWRLSEQKGLQENKTKKKTFYK